MIFVKDVLQWEFVSFTTGEMSHECFLTGDSLNESTMDVFVDAGKNQEKAVASFPPINSSRQLDSQTSSGEAQL